MKIYQLSLMMGLGVLIASAPAEARHHRLKTTRVTKTTEQTQEKTEREKKGEAGAEFAFDRIEQDKLFFKSQKEGSAASSSGQPTDPNSAHFIKTNLRNLSYIGQTRSKDGTTYFVVSAKPCENCFEDRAIYLFKPQYPSEKPLTFVYPGKVYEPKNRALVYQSRSFYGKCSSDVNIGYLSYQFEKVDRRPSMQPSTYYMELGRMPKDKLKEKSFSHSMRETLRLVKNDQCHEIEGRNRLISSRPLDLGPTAKLTLSEQDDEAGTDAEAQPKK